MMQPQLSKFALFLGDLSMHCNEADLQEAFAPYGNIVEIRVKRSKETAKTLSYGFLEFDSASSAVNAMNDMDGVVLKGRPLRIRWAASKKNPVRKRDIREDLNARISMHVKFMSYKIDKIISEELIRNIFSVYGEVCDTTIKQISIDKKSHRLKGYGFVSYYNDEAGLHAAQRALAELHDTTLDDVTYKCELSNILETLASQQMNHMHAPYAAHQGMLPPMGVLNAYGEIEYQDVGQHQSSYYDDYSAHNGLSLHLPSGGDGYAAQAPGTANGADGTATHYFGNTPRSSFESTFDQMSPPASLGTASPGANVFAQSLSNGGAGSALLLSSLTDGKQDLLTAPNSVEGLDGPLSAGNDELRGLYAFSPANTAGTTPSTVQRSSPADTLLGPEASNGLPQPPSANGGLSLAPRPLHPASRGPSGHPLYGHGQPPQARYGNGPGNGPGYPENGHGGPLYLQRQHSAESGGQHGLDGHLPPAHLRRSVSGGPYNGGSYAPHTQHGQVPYWQQQQHLQRQHAYGPGAYQSLEFPKGYGAQQQLFEAQGRMHGQMQGQGQYTHGQQQHQHQLGQNHARPPIYARTSPPTPTTSQQQLQQHQLQLLSQQFAQRDLQVNAFDVSAASPRQPPSPGRGSFGDLSLDILNVGTDLSLGGSFALSQQSSSSALGGALYLGASSASTAGEPFPLRDLGSRSASSTSSGISSVIGKPNPSAASLLAVAALGGSTDSVQPLGTEAALVVDAAVGVGADLLEGDPNLWLPPNFDLPQM